MKSLTYISLIFSCLILLLTACGSGDGGVTPKASYLVVSVGTEEAVDFATTQASFGGGLSFEHFVNDTDRVLAEVKQTEPGRLNLVFMAETPFAGTLGRLVFKIEGSGDTGVTVKPFQVGDGPEVPVTTEEEETETPPDPKGNPDEELDRNVPADGIQYVPEMANYPLSDLNKSGEVTLQDVLMLKSILLGDIIPSDFELYHGDIVLDSKIDFFDIAQLSAKATGEAPPTLHVAPREFQAEVGETAYILVGNAGAGSLPELVVVVWFGQIGTIFDNPAEEVTPTGAVGRVFEVVGDGSSLGLLFTAGEAGRKISLNNLGLEINPASTSQERTLADVAKQEANYQKLHSYLQDEGYVEQADAQAHLINDNGSVIQRLHVTSFQQGTKGEKARLIFGLDERDDVKASIVQITDLEDKLLAYLVINKAGVVERIEVPESLDSQSIPSCLTTSIVTTGDGGGGGGGGGLFCCDECGGLAAAAGLGSGIGCAIAIKHGVCLAVGGGMAAFALYKCKTELCSECKPPPDPPCLLDQGVCEPPPCVSCGDPHLYTFDRLAYDFQAAGEFLLSQSDSGDLVVQARQEPYGSHETIAVNTAVAMNVVGDRVGVYVDRSPPLYVNGQATELVDSSLALPNGGTVVNSGDLYLVTWPDGSVFSAEMRSSYLNIGASLAEARQGKVSGLLGNFDGDSSNDIFSRDGEGFVEPVEFFELYGTYGDSWRITQDESLFDYLAGKNTSSFTIADFPKEYVSADTLSDAEYQAAKAVCEAAGITDPVALENCILDVALTGDESFADSGTNTAPTDDVLEVCPEPILIDTDINVSTTWGPITAGCSHYIVEGRGFVGENVVLTIEPGTHVVFKEDSGLYAFTDGSAIHAVGTAEQPIIFDGVESTAGYWRGLAFNSDSPLNELNHVVISGAGSYGYQYEDDKSGIFVLQGRLKVANTTVENSGGHGLKVTDGSNLESFANNRFAGNEGSPVVLVAPDIGYLDGATDYNVAGAPNGEPYIRVDRDINYVQTDQTWPKTDVPYRFQAGHLIQAGEVTIEPGAVLEFAEDASLAVSHLDPGGGALIADAEGGEPIIFRGTSDGQGWWIGLRITSANPKNELNNVVVSGAGAEYSAFLPGANVWVGQDTVVELRNSTIKDSAEYGIYISTNGGATVPADPTSNEANNTFDNNASGPVGPTGP